MTIHRLGRSCRSLTHYTETLVISRSVLRLERLRMGGNIFFSIIILGLRVGERESRSGWKVEGGDRRSVRVLTFLAAKVALSALVI